MKRDRLEKQIIDYGFIGQKSVIINFLNSIDITKLKSQFSQDLFVLIILGYKKDGYFVEFGAFDGVYTSNTYFLELLGWNGVLAEPSRKYKWIKNNRRVESFNLAVFSRSELEIDFLDNGGLSTLLSFKNYDFIERKGIVYKVRTITLSDLLIRANSPSYIDYISIDTEGSEFEILNVFDFNRYRFGIITIEHNNIADKRNKIYELLSKHGYVRVLYNLTEVDDWYLDRKLFIEKKYLFTVKQ